RIIKERFYNRLPLFIRPLYYFFYRYFLRLGFLDGVEGFAYHFMQGLWYRCLVDLKYLEAERVLDGAITNQEKISRLEKLTGFKL
ncbi:glycosyltransferase family 2 protein, partial [Methylomonas sp. WSC-7]|nr:glycosyltransferase family 2 protein [Methylomonas sp. WSC-7]